MILNNQDTRYNNQAMTKKLIKQCPKPCTIMVQGKSQLNNFWDLFNCLIVTFIFLSWLLVICSFPGIAETKEAMALNFWQEFDIVFWQTLPFAGFWCYLIGSQLGPVNWNNVLTFSVLLSAGNAYHYAYRVSKPKTTF